MEIKQARAMWPENIGFRLEREDTGNEYILLHYHTPVEVLTRDGLIRTSGNSFIIQQKHSHQLFTVVEKPLQHDWVHFEGYLDYLMQKSNLSYNALYEISDGNIITQIVYELELELIRQGIYFNDIMSNKLELLIMLLGRIVNTPTYTPLNTSLSEKLLFVRSYVHQRYSEKWTVESMAKLIHLSPSKFYDSYKANFGISPKLDLQHIRIEHATYMLLHRDYSIKEIAEKIGYENEYYFIRKFQEFKGEPPGKYRKHYK